MNLSGIKLFEGVPKIALIAGIPVVAFIVTIGFTLAKNGGDGGQAQPPPTLEVAVQKSQVTPTPQASPTPAVTRTCAQIQGTAYQSDAERDYYTKSCSGATQTATGGGATGGGANQASGPRRAVETTLGDRIIINRIGVDAPVTRAAVGGDGVMPDPVGYFNLVMYDFSAIPGLGGSPSGGGNAVMAGHVDCAACGAGGTPGLAVLYYLRNLGNGDVIEYYTQAGGYFKYVVTYAGDLQPDADWASIVSAGSADLTIITCSGTFVASAHEYTTRRVVQARKA